MKHWSTSFVVPTALIALATRAAAQDVLVSYDFSSVLFSDSSSLVHRGVLPVPMNGPVTCLAHAGGGVFYGVEGFGSDGQPESLVRIDAHSGTRVQVGSTGFEWDARGIALDPATGLLYVLAASISPPSITLYVVDTSNAATTPVAALGNLNVRPATFSIDAQGNAFVAAVLSSHPQLPAHFRLFQLDLNSGQTTLVGDSPDNLLPNPQLIEASFRGDGALLVLADWNLYALDVTTLSATLLTQTWTRRSLACAPADAVGLAYVEGCSGNPTGCPCGPNNTGSPGNGCGHSEEVSGANLRAYGSASLSNDTLELVALGLPDTTGLFFQGASVVASAPFGDGLRCVFGPTRRMGAGAIVNGRLAYPSGGAASVSVQGQIAAPGTFHYQMIFRDNAPFCTSATVNLANSVTLTWLP